MAWSLRARGWALLAVLALCGISSVLAVDRTKFRKCADTSFCRRHRAHNPDDKVGLFRVPAAARAARRPAYPASGFDDTAPEP